MAKYAGKTQTPVITDPIIDIVDDALGFQQSEICSEAFIQPGAPGYLWKWVRIGSHRRCGFSYTALQLLEQHPTSLIVTHSQHAANRLRQQAIENHLVPKLLDAFHDNIAIEEYIIPFERMDDRWFIKNQHRQHKLIIFDAASMMGRQTRGNSLHPFRERLFNKCELIVELG
jgi:hypothetical protein